MSSGSPAAAVDALRPLSGPAVPLWDDFRSAPFAETRMPGVAP